MSLRITLYGKPDCHLCHEAQTLLERLAAEYDLAVETVDITQDPLLWKRYRTLIPVVEVEGGPKLTLKIDAETLRQALEAVGAQRTVSGKER